MKTNLDILWKKSDIFWLASELTDRVTFWIKNTFYVYETRKIVETEQQE